MLKGIHSNTTNKKDLHIIHLPGDLRLRLWRQPKYPRKSSSPVPTPLWEEMSVQYGIKFPLTAKSAMMMIENNNTLGSLWMWRPTSTRSNRLRRSTMYKMYNLVWHWRGQGQHPDHAWWGEEGICLTGSRLWCFGCCQQKWHHLNWVQLVNSKYKNFKLKKEKSKSALAGYGSVDWVLACYLKGHWLDYQSGHEGGLWARSKLGVWEATDGCISCTSMFLSLFFPPSPCL